ncbi:MAG: peroxidase [Thermoanaerobaculia bacterium]
MAKGDDETVRAVLADYRTAPVSERLRAMLGFLEKLTLRPAEVGPEDVAPLRAAGLTREEIEDAIHVCVLFNLINRIADSLGFEPQTEAGYAGSARRLLSAVGYR